MNPTALTITHETYSPQTILFNTSGYPVEPPKLKEVPKIKYQCVTYARARTGIQQVRGVAKNIQTNSTTPVVGAVVKTNESRYGHVAIVSDIRDGYLVLDEANYDLHGSIKKGRLLPINSPKILGYIQ